MPRLNPRVPAGVNRASRTSRVRAKARRSWPDARPLRAGPMRIAGAPGIFRDALTHRAECVWPVPRAGGYTSPRIPPFDSMCRCAGHPHPEGARLMELAKQEDLDHAVAALAAGNIDAL